jgi:uncharacterized membrane protein YeaQ/YmgE (transglycosylase-associated protein family)
MPIDLIIQLVSGAAGGNIAGVLLKNQSLGVVGNSIAGIIGGGVGGKVLGGLLGVAAAQSGGLDFGTIVSSVVTGGAGGGVLMAVVGLLRSMLSN